MVLERILPARKERPLNIELPDIVTAEDIVKATTATIKHITQGDLTLSEGNALITMFEQLRKTIETQELEARIEALEEQQ